ncbi:hypothetical protein M408DRAFT_70542 [Serendipita vermifera MAFF 305830]|uniref:Mitochondrial distribution and morphology protein 12 n=1 Tax=Serendipita vermifera MAFF 305830 TaxID=933852 RepID=A0A0C2WNG1_SERVB|nr:hypothetical protein M408DRAFT_70542 [Serendipita vermifera MAFF 305830]
MSIDLDWPQLSTLSNRLVDSLNRLLKTTERPSFLGPITVNGFEFGSTPPDVELVDVRDIYPDFLEDEQDAESGSSSDINAASDEDENGVWNGSQRANNYNGQTALPGARVAASVDTALQPEPPLETHESHLPKVNMDNDLQFHLRVIFHSDMRINISTSLLLNYPSPLFMALPIRLTVVGFEFDGEVVAAYQPSKKRVHICVLDDDDPYQKISAGARLLPHIFIESEIGQADQQVLRNVSRVEKFIQDMVRMTLEQELVFPNFQTIVYGEEE